MIRTINPYATARTAEIMSRYRPIAPKPEPTDGNNGATETDQSSGGSGGMPSSISKSPYLRNVWAHLQARPTRTRKRGRTAAFAPPSSSSVVKRSRTCLQGLASPFQLPPAMHGFANVNPNAQISLVPLKCALDTAVTTLADSVAALPFIRCAPQLPFMGKDAGIDLNMELASDPNPPLELDFMPQLKEPVKTSVISPSVITPQPIRPVGSSIIVKSILSSDDQAAVAKEIKKKPEDVEKEVESEAVPAVVSDSGNRVRLANSAYKEMVGQPECCWLEAACGGACKRIGGEVVLQFEESCTSLKIGMNRFTCRVKIEWGSNGKRRYVEALCSGVKIACEAKDYQFLWRFHTKASAEDDHASNSDI